MDSPAEQLEESPAEQRLAPTHQDDRACLQLREPGLPVLRRSCLQRVFPGMPAAGSGWNATSSEILTSCARLSLAPGAVTELKWPWLTWL